MPKVKSSDKVGKKTTTSATVSPKAITDKQTKSEIIVAITEETGLAKKQVQQVLETLGSMILRHMRKRGSGEFTLPYTGIRVIRKTRPATPKRQGRNPATGESIMIPAKPARVVVKLRVLKPLKESVSK